MGELFEVLTSKKRFDANKVQVFEEGKNPYVVRTSSNNGQRGFIDEDELYLNDGNTISFGQDTATMFYQEKPYFTGDKIKILKAKNKKFNKNNSQFFISTMAKAFSAFSWGSSSFNVSIIENQKLTLPTQNGKIDFAFMENFIAELEAERIAELEAERIAELEAYLKVTGLGDYILTEEERAVLEAFRNGKISWGGVKLPNGQEVTNIEWKMFRMEDVLEWQPQKEIDPLKLDNLKDVSQKLYPFYGQATINNGIISYNQLVDEVLNNKEGKSTILIHSNNQNTVYLETPFYLKDGHGATSVLQSEKLNKLNALYFMSSIKKVILSKYSYNAKATKIELKNTLISLPSSQGVPLYAYMEVFIKAVQKLVIKEVVEYADRKIAGTKEIVNY